jgi:fatty acid desaturase
METTVPKPVLTSITQALADGVLTRRDLRDLMKRSDATSLLYLGAWCVTLAATGVLVWLCLGSVWIWPAMVVHGIVVVHHFSLQHECCHYTVFRTRWLNDVVGSICGFVIMLPNRHFRYEHCDHHTYTNLKGADPELIPLPASLWGYLWYLSSWPYWRNKFTELARHVLGRLSIEEQRFIPAEEHRTVFWEARLMAVGYAGIVTLCGYTGWWAPLWFWWLPLLFGEPFMRAIRLTEHVGRPNVTDMKSNTRTNLVSPPLRFLCWNMNYHAEHHYASSVPFHALPALHQKLKDHVYVEQRGYLGAHLEMLGQILGRAPRCDITPDNEQ